MLCVSQRACAAEYIHAQSEGKTLLPSDRVALWKYGDMHTPLDKLRIRGLHETPARVRPCEYFRTTHSTVRTSTVLYYCLYFPKSYGAPVRYLAVKKHNIECAVRNNTQPYIGFIKLGLILNHGDLETKKYRVISKPC